jgi:hypothetical protein
VQFSDRELEACLLQELCFLLVRQELAEDAVCLQHFLRVAVDLQTQVQAKSAAAVELRFAMATFTNLWQAQAGTPSGLEFSQGLQAWTPRATGDLFAGQRFQDGQRGVGGAGLADAASEAQQAGVPGGGGAGSPVHPQRGGALLGDGALEGLVWDVPQDAMGLWSQLRLGARASDSHLCNDETFSASLARTHLLRPQPVVDGFARDAASPFPLAPVLGKLQQQLGVGHVSGARVEHIDVTVLNAIFGQGCSHGDE